MKNKFALSVLALIAGTAIIFAAQNQQNTRTRPNVVVILCDDLRWDCMSCAGHSYLKTPNIDRLANEGVRFANAFCTTSLCSPSRASILSGLYAHSHKVMDNFTEFPANIPSFATRLHDEGYETAYIGKWHMGENNDERRPGFDYFVTHKGQGKYYGTEFNINGERKTLDGYYTHIVTDLAVQWLNKPHNKPFLLMLGHKAPHSFYIPEPKYSNIFDNVQIKYPDTAFNLEGKPQWIKDRLITWHGIYGPLFEWRKNFPDTSPEGVKDFAAMTRAYWGTILSVDDSTGALYSTLKKLGQLDNTIIIFMGDNGLLNGEHGMVDKRTMHEPSIRIPLIVRYPGLTPINNPKVIEQLVLTVDIAPSILDLCNAKPLKNIHGKSFKKLVQQGDPDWRKSFFYEYNYEKQFPYTPNIRGVRTEEWKYMHYPTGDGSPDKHLAELYNIKNDPEERHNLINDPQYSNVLKQLQNELKKLMKQTGLKKDFMPVDEGIKKELPEKSIR
ncbi:MAG: sulfatase family protein [Verrucomicrobiia bacterium]